MFFTGVRYERTREPAVSGQEIQPDPTPTKRFGRPGRGKKRRQE